MCCSGALRTIKITAMDHKKLNFLRYPGGKQRILNDLIPHLPLRESISGKFVEPFVGGGAVFFAFNPREALLADINPELIDLYRGLRRCPVKVWKKFCMFPATKEAYYNIRNSEVKGLDLASRAARTLYLNRTCFKGMWRHNANGQFNVGYGGQDRRWVICKDTLIEVSKRLKCATLKKGDFKKIINMCSEEDFIFLDPPYRPGEREMVHDHYVYGKFSYDDYERLAKVLEQASHRGVQWAMTTSSHPDVLSLFHGNQVIKLPRGTGRSPGILTNNSGEVLICNYKEIRK